MKIMVNRSKLREQLYPQSAGVYFFKDADHSILYIGKAKNLKNRISSYFSSSDIKTIELIQQSVVIECIITHNEIEALFLEAQLIKKHQPLFNRLLKSGTPFTYIFISQDDVSMISITRAKKKKKATTLVRFCQKKMHSAL